MLTIASGPSVDKSHAIIGVCVGWTALLVFGSKGYFAGIRAFLDSKTGSSPTAAAASGGGGMGIVGENTGGGGGQSMTTPASVPIEPLTTPTIKPMVIGK